MQPSDIESLSRSVVPGTGAPDIRRIGCGLSYDTYRVDRNGCAYALRVAVPQRVDLGQDLEWEARVLETAGRAGLAPLLLYCDPAHGVVVSRWVYGRGWGLKQARSCANIGNLAGLLRSVHALKVPAPVRCMSPRAWVDCYIVALAHARRQVEPVLKAAAAKRLHDLSRLPNVAAALCHSDLHTLNLVERDASLVLLDWEYAHVSEPLWDLAGWSANNDFAEEAQRNLLTNYLGTAPSLPLWTRFRLILWLYDYICLLWSELFLSVRPANPLLAKRATQLDARLRLPAHYLA
jgi:aminoglycoside phosphotransferase (APT) family kinase protein